MSYVYVIIKQLGRGGRELYQGENETLVVKPAPTKDVSSELPSALISPSFPFPVPL
ncbi:hypothetical protein [Coleofasciculus sp. G2-EDA-02]|uniref:hypothetical protein n=1 Tax=Coleofasciculus sp. G2-EDA-02 TaxID=3069529 RepID=UPI0032FFAF47